MFLLHEPGTQRIYWCVVFLLFECVDTQAWTNHGTHFEPKLWRRQSLTSQHSWGISYRCKIPADSNILASLHTPSDKFITAKGNIWALAVLIVWKTKFSIVISSPRAYLSRNRREIMWVSNYRCPIWTRFVIGYPRHLHVNYARFNGFVFET